VHLLYIDPTRYSEGWKVSTLTATTTHDTHIKATVATKTKMSSLSLTLESFFGHNKFIHIMLLLLCLPWTMVTAGNELPSLLSSFSSSSRARIVADNLEYWNDPENPLGVRWSIGEEEMEEEDPFLITPPKNKPWEGFIGADPPEALHLHLLEDDASSSASSPFSGKIRPSGMSQTIDPLFPIDENPYHPKRFQYRHPTTRRNNGGTSSSGSSATRSRRVYKTGTTIAGCVVRLESSNSNGTTTTTSGDYVLLAADTRATESTMIADPNCEKIHALADNVYCCGAGTSADCDHVTRQCMYSMALEALIYQNLHQNGHHNDDTEDSATTKATTTTTTTSFDSTTNPDKLIVSHHVSLDQASCWLQDVLFDKNGELGVNLILGGVFQGHGELRALHPHGSMDRGLPFAALGSGGWAAMSVLEQGYAAMLQRSTSLVNASTTPTTTTHQNIATVSSLDEAIQLVTRAIRAGIQNDLGSGSHVDLCIIRPDGTSNYTRHVIAEDELPVIVSSSVSASSTPAGRNEDTLSRSNTSSGGGGVNGFGNLPFAIRSRHVRRASHSHAEEHRQSQWSYLLEWPSDEVE
jgi:20S proteasome subunit beta 2